MALAHNAAFTPSAKAKAQFDSLSPEEKVGQLFLITFNGNDTSPVSPIFDLIVNYHLGGVILDRDNDNFLNLDQMPEECRTLSNNLQLLEYDGISLLAEDSPVTGNQNSNFIPLFVGLSQEGNQSDFSEILFGLSPIPSQMSIGATWDDELAERTGEQVGNELSNLGINMLFGPSLDVITNPSPGQSNLGVRSFGGDPFWVGKMGQAYVRGVHQGSQDSIVVVGKYFPGLGSSDRLPEDEVATVRKSLEQLKQIDLAPFFAVTGHAPSPDSAVDALLNSHIRYQGLQGNIRSTTKPISLDPQAFDLLMNLEPFGSWRESGGLIISDNLGSQALQKLYDPSGVTFNIRRVAVDAFIAGNDVLYLGNYGGDNEPIPNNEIISTLDFFAQKYIEDQDFADRVDESVLRILTVKNSLYLNFNISSVLASQYNLSELGNGDIAEIVARQSATLINPSQAELDVVLQDPPSSYDRVVILSDTEIETLCEECPEVSTLGIDSLEKAILKLYGPLSGRQLVRANITSYSFKEIITLLDFPDEVVHIINDLYNADWILVSALDVSEDRPYSKAFTRLLAERQDLLRDKKIIVFALGAPYYLDATNISKITAFFGLYNKLPASLDVAARILFKEFPSITGHLPVSVPGINYDLISATSPNPDQVFSLFVGEDVNLTTTLEPSESTPAAPVYRVEDIIELHTGIIFDHNWNPVPDGTPVTFYITTQGKSTALPQITTLNGSASTSFLVKSGNNITVQAESSLARSESIEITILGDSIEGVETENNGDPTLDSTQSPTELQPGPGSETPQPDQIEPNGAPWQIWFVSLVIIITVSLIAYQAGALSGFVRSGIKWGFASLISGLLVYNYIALNLPGVSWLLSDNITLFTMGLSVLVGALLGWLISYLYLKLFSA
ncbi:MAG: glycoside hydrolase family 3 N-terminal domain-containing protein [Anaerolineales bacterium]